jgi:endonuclease/exonuclease/phosphatase family metal-dependent hydrolase
MLTHLNILTYNVMIPILPPVRNYGQFERVHKIKHAIRNCETDVDILVLNEVIPQSIIDIVIVDMATMGFKYHTTPLKDTMAESGGVFIFSKFVITQTKKTLFGSSCTGSDCLSSKGVVYARVRLEDGIWVNVFATHMQAWPGIQTQHVRSEQTARIKHFIDSMHIPESEPVFLCGDLNMDLYVDNAHFKHLMFVLNMDIPTIAENSHTFTVDPEQNILVGSDDPSQYHNAEWPKGCVSEYFATQKCPCCPSEWLDYILFSKGHLKPIRTRITAIPVKVEPFQMPFSMTSRVLSRDVSDHFPVLGEFEFDMVVQTAEDRVNEDTLDVKPADMNNNTFQNVFFIVLIGMAIVMMMIVLITKLKHKNRSAESPTARKKTNRV